MSKRSGGIDYSKWDKMNFSDDDDDDESDDDSTHAKNAPRVTRLDEPSRVTCNPDGSVQINKATTTATTTAKAIEETEESVSKVKPLYDRFVKSDDDKTKNDKLNLLTRNGGSFVDPSTGTESYWSQDRNEVVLSIAFDPSKFSSRHIRVQVRGALNYKDRFAAVGGDRATDTGTGTKGGSGNSKGKINVTTTCGSTIIEGYLAYAIYLPEDEEEVDWEIDATNPKKKLIKITLLKALPMQGLTIWWSKPMMNYPEIDVVKDIEGRGNEDGDAKTKSKQEKMKASWDEAHRLFREKVKNREKQVIDINS